MMREACNPAPSNIFPSVNNAPDFGWKERVRWERGERGGQGAWGGQRETGAERVEEPWQSSSPMPQINPAAGPNNSLSDIN